MKNAHLTAHPFRTRIIHAVAYVLGVVVHIEGIPFGRFVTNPARIDYPDPERR